MFIDYNNYIQSKEWEIKKREILHNKTFRKCCVCESKNRPINFHHINYKNLGNETEKDLISICTKCHKSLHKWMKLNRIKDFENKKQLIDFIHLYKFEILTVPKNFLKNH